MCTNGHHCADVLGIYGFCHIRKYTYLQFLHFSHLPVDGLSALLVLLLEGLKSQLSFLRTLLVLFCLALELLPQLVQGRLALGTQGMRVLQVL